MPQAMSYSEVRQNLAKVMSLVCDCHEPLIITRPHAPSVVLMSLEEYNSILETLYLLRSPCNASRLREARIAASNTQEHPLAD